MGYMTAGRRIARGRSYTVCTALPVVAADTGDILKTMEFADGATARVTYTIAAFDAEPGGTANVEIQTAPISTNENLWATVDPGQWIGDGGTVGEQNGVFYAAFAALHRFVRVKLVIADSSATITVKVECV